MIGYLKGQILSKDPSQITIETGGVGYAVEIPVSCFYTLGSPGTLVELFIHTHVREDAIVLFGFPTTGERSLFRKLIAISGIGPKIALGIIGGMGPAELLTAVDAGDFPRIVQIPGIGRKTAERLVLELRDKLPDLRVELELQAVPVTSDSSMRSDLISALENLGYKKTLAEKAVNAAMQDAAASEDFEAALKKALVILTR